LLIIFIYFVYWVKRVCIEVSIKYCNIQELRSINLSEANQNMLHEIRLQVCQKLAFCEKKAVIVQPDEEKIALMNLPIILGMIEAGYKPTIIFTGRNIGEARDFYSKIGLSNFIYFNFLVGRFDIKAIASIQKIKSKIDLINFSYQKIEVGKYVFATFIRRNRLGGLNLNNLKQIKSFFQILFEGIDSSIRANRVIEVIKPDVALFMDRNYLPNGPIFDACINHNSNVITSNASHRNNQLVLKSYSFRNSRTHPSSISDKNWALISLLKWGEFNESLIKKEIESCYSSGEWYGEVGTQFNAKTKSTTEIAEILKIDTNKKNVLVFPHIFWDATFFFGIDVYETYQEWFLDTMEIAWKNHFVNWIIKIHPANIVKNKRDGINQEYLEVKVLKKFGDIPPHIKIIYPDSPISTISLLQIGDTCLTVRGTVGIEAACYGLNVITAGTGRYDSCGFTTNVTTKNEWRSQLRNIHNKKRPSKDLVELAQKYAYGVFMLRPLSLSIVNFEYLKDETASLVISLVEKNAFNIFNSPDVRAIYKWMISGEEDYIKIS